MATGARFTLAIPATNSFSTDTLLWLRRARGRKRKGGGLETHSASQPTPSPSL
jgi:hypothetical protein